MVFKNRFELFNRQYYEMPLSFITIYIELATFTLDECYTKSFHDTTLVQPIVIDETRQVLLYNICLVNYHYL